MPMVQGDQESVTSLAGDDNNEEDGDPMQTALKLMSKDVRMEER